MNLARLYADRIREALKPLSRQADYWDVRLGESSGTILSYRSKVLEELSFPKSFGGSIRVLFHGGWGFVTFPDLSALVQSSQEALAYAKLVGKSKSHFAPVDATIDSVPAPSSLTDFVSVATEEKVRLLNHYRDLLWRQKSAVVQTSLYYLDLLATKLFLSSDGSVIEQEVPRLTAQINLIAKKSGIVQQYWDRLSFTNFSALKNQDQKIKEALKVVNQLVESRPAKGGHFPVVMDGKLAGTFAHEAFGHLSEADNVEKDPALKKIMKLGRMFGSRHITIYDDPSAGRYPFYRYDDEGVRATKTILLDKGVLVGRLHSRETAATLKEAANGHGRAAGTAYRPIVRMGNTAISPGKSNLTDLFAGIKFGYYCRSWYAGMTDHENFTFAALYAYEIVNSRLGKMVRDIKLSGNVFKTLHAVDAVGNDLTVEPGTCGKMQQHTPVLTTAPSIRLSQAQVLGV